MGRHFGEQIAVLDGFEDGSSTIDYDTSESDGRIGQMRADAAQYATVTARGPAGITATKRSMVLDASAGANYSGGSTYAPGLPLLPSTVGLAAIPSVLPPRTMVLDPSGGANYSGGSSWTGGLPLTPSNSGLAAALIQGGYGAGGLGRVMAARRARARGLRGFAGRDDGYGRTGLGGRDDGYGRAGLGAPMPGADSDLCGAFASVELGRFNDLDPEDGRLGQERPRVDQYAKMVAPNVLQKQNVIDPSGGANYSGGSSWTGGIPLISSNSGLAGLDRLSDAQLSKAVMKLRQKGVRIDRGKTMRNLGQDPLKALQRHAMAIQRNWDMLAPEQQQRALSLLKLLGIVREGRAKIVAAARAA